jgi:hypothetical protein
VRKKMLFVAPTLIVHGRLDELTKSVCPPTSPAAQPGQHDFPPCGKVDTGEDSFGWTSGS